MDVALAVLLWIAASFAGLLLLGLFIGIYRIARYGDARGPASAYDRDVAEAWRRVSAMPVVLDRSSASSALVSTMIECSPADARTLGIAVDRGRR